MKIQQDFSDYVLKNPGYTDLRNCAVLPGVSCRSMNVKRPGTIDLETRLLRGKPSDLETLAMVKPEPEPDQEPVQVPSAKTQVSFLGSLSSEPTRMSKSCYFEQSSDHWVHPGFVGAPEHPLMRDRVGTSSRAYKN